MKMNNIKGSLSFKSNLELDELGIVLSTNLFGSIKFVGLEESIHDHIPAIYLEYLVLGLRIELDGYSGFGNDEWFTMYVHTCYSIKLEGDSDSVDVSRYLYELCKEGLKNHPEILVIKP